MAMEFWIQWNASITASSSGTRPRKAFLRLQRPVVHAPPAAIAIQLRIESVEHVDFSLSRNADTGAVTVTYTSPKELPVKFSWTATVQIDGTVTTTPFTIEKPA